MLKAISATNLRSDYDPKMGITLAEHALNLGAEAAPSFEELVKRATIINTLERLPVPDEKRLQLEYEELLRVYQTISIASTSNESYPSEARSKFLKELGEVMQPFLVRHNARKTLHSKPPGVPSLSPTRVQDTTPKSKNAALWLLPEVDPPTPLPLNNYKVSPSQDLEKQPVQEKTESRTNITKRRSSWYFSGITNMVDYLKVARSRSPPVTLK